MMLTADALSDAKPLRHAFFTREGGVSDGIYASLNCGLGSGDEAAHVHANRARALRRLGMPEGALTTAYQIHSADVAVVEEPWRETSRPKLDAMVTDRPGIALGILTADCAPVLLADPRAGVVGAAHAGWRGATAGILEATVSRMEALGADRASVAAAVGPCIHQPSYEVGPEFHQAVTAADPGHGDFFTPARRQGHHMFDLPGYIGRRLDQLGLAACEILPHDTCADAARFFSYRRTTLNGGGDYGRLLSVIALAD